MARLLLPLSLTVVLVATLPACKKAPESGAPVASAPSGGGGGEGGGGGGGGGGGRNKRARAAGAAGTSTTPAEPFRVDGVAGGVRGSRPGGGTGLGTGGGPAGQQEAETEVHGQQRQRPAAVYLDGRPLAAVAYGDLPPGLEATWITFDNGNKVRRFSVARYLEALGVPMDKVKALHFHSGRQRVGILTGDQLRKDAEAAMFSFTQDTTGKARMHFSPQSGITAAIDRLWTLAVYAEKPAPTVNQVTHVLELDGKPLSELAYVTEPVGGGARLYLDGNLAGYVKRQQLDAQTSSVSGPVALTLGQALEKNRIDAKAIKAAQLVGDDKVVASIPVAQLERYPLTLTQHSGGYLKNADGAEGNVILLYARTQPPDPSKR